MVRLKVTFSSDVGDPDSGFQFHNGSIKSNKQVATRYRLYKFQFHNGSIKSTFVAFELDQPVEFQFHNGSIKSKS